MRKIMNSPVWPYVILCTLLALLDWLGFCLHGSVSVFVAWLFIALALMQVGGILIFTVKALWLDIQDKNILIIPLLGVLAYIFFSNIQSGIILPFNQDSAQEMAWGVKALHHPDSMLYQPGLLGYPIREMMLMALPTYWTGPSILNLHLGGAVFGFLSSLLFYSGLRRWFYGKTYGILLPGLITIVPFTASQLWFWFLRYEQTNLPMFMSMLVTGWLLWLAHRNTLIRRLHLLWILWLLPHIYAPALSLWTLVLVASLWLTIHLYHKRERIVLWQVVSTASFMIATVTIAYLGRYDLRVTPQDESPMLQILWEGFTSFFTQFLHPLLLFPVIVYLVVGLIGRWGATAPANLSMGFGRYCIRLYCPWLHHY